MASKIWNPYPSPIFDQNDRVAAGAKAYFYNAGTLTPLTVYTDSALTVPHPHPVVANGNGVFDAVYLPYASYKVRVLTSDDILIFQADGIENEAPPDAGGGGGIVVATEQIFQTGDIIGLLTSGTRTGWVRMNAKTIGSAVSGATERANADTQSLFTFLWTNFSNTDCPVSTGRGASAAADWAANKTIGIPTMQGYLLAGADDMGGTAANRLQVSTTCTATNGSVNIMVASATGLAVGMKVIIADVAAGQITNISGTTVTLNTAYTGTTGSGKTVRASFITDAQAMASTGGAQTVTQTTKELAAHTHGVTDPGHTHDYDKVGGSGTIAAGSGATNSVNTATSSETTGITINSAGSGLPMNNLPPMRIGTFYMKL